jgi:hypothetical protein
MEVLLVGTLLHGCVQMVSTWLDLKSLLASLAGLPLATAFIARSRVRSKRPLWVQNLSLQSLSTLVRGPLILHDIWLRRPMIFQVAQGGKTIDLYKDYGEKIRSLITGTEKPDESPTDALARNRRVSALNTRITRKLFNEVILPHWRNTPLVDKLEWIEHREDGSERAPAGQVGISGDPGRVEDLAQAFVALHFSSFLLYSVRQIQNLVWSSSLGFVALAIAMNADSPQSPQ